MLDMAFELSDTSRLHTYGSLPGRSFDLSSRIETDNNSVVELKEIIILDLNNRGNSV